MTGPRAGLSATAVGRGGAPGAASFESAQLLRLRLGPLPGARPDGVEAEHSRQRGVLRRPKATRMQRPVDQRPMEASFQWVARPAEGR
jgi:hypothetical protein